MALFVNWPRRFLVVLERGVHQLATIALEIRKFRLQFYRHTHRTQVRFNFAVGSPEPKVKETTMLEVNLTNEQKIPITVNPVTATGRPATLDGPITVTPQSGDGTVEMIDDKSFFAVSGDNPGDTVYLVEGDADLGSGVQTISDIVTAHVAGANAANLGVTAGTAVPK